MNNIDMLKVIVTGAFFLGLNCAFAEEPGDDEADVWSTIEEEWNASEKRNPKWPQRLMHDDLSAWEKTSPVPRDKDSMEMWYRFNQRTGKLVAHELYALSIIVHDDVAVAHYLYSTAYETKDGDFARSNGRYTDILVRTDDGWKFLAWHGGDDE